MLTPHPTSYKITRSAKSGVHKNWNKFRNLTVIEMKFVGSVENACSQLHAKMICPEAAMTSRAVGGNLEVVRPLGEGSKMLRAERAKNIFFSYF